MNRRPKKGHVDAEQEYHVIEYPPGYKGQSLTPDSINFSDRFFESTENQLWFVRILLKNFASEVGCGNSQESLDYLEAISNGFDYCWTPSNLTGVLVISFLDKSQKCPKRMLLLITMREMSDLIGVTVGSESGPSDKSAFDEEASNESSAKVFH